MTSANLEKMKNMIDKYYETHTKEECSHFVDILRSKYDEPGIYAEVAALFKEAHQIDGKTAEFLYGLGEGLKDKRDCLKEWVSSEREKRSKAQGHAD
jgi:hypothetical protein